MPYGFSLKKKLTVNLFRISTHQFFNKKVPGHVPFSNLLLGNRKRGESFFDKVKIAAPEGCRGTMNTTLAHRL